jgi:hypothetical protein
MISNGACLVALLAAASMACVEVHSIPRVAGGQLIDLDAGKRLVVQVEGVQTKSDEFDGVWRAREGEAIHRVLQSRGGTILFAYDLRVRKSGAGDGYRFELKPAAGKAPTFDASREVTVNAQDAVRVELMEQQGTGRKVEDVFRLVDTSGNAAETHFAIGAHLRAAHQLIYRWVHGE